jgi:prepilin-type N-terminal cleavage/methylation domain-containing protein
MKHNQSKSKIVKMNKGFTLLELMVVVACVGVLSSVGLPFYRGFQEKSRAIEAKLILSNLARAEDSFMAMAGSYTTCFEALGIGSPGSHYFSYGFSSMIPNEVNGLINTGIIPSTCLWTDVTDQDKISRRGTKSIGLPIAPDPSEMHSRFTLGPNLQAYFALAAGNIGDGTTFVFFNPLVSSAIASEPIAPMNAQFGFFEDTLAYVFHPKKGLYVIDLGGDVDDLLDFEEAEGHPDHGAGGMDGDSGI